MKMICILLGVICGILFGERHDAGSLAALALGGAIGVRIIIAATLHYKPYYLPRLGYFHYLWAFLLFLSLGSLSVRIHDPDFGGCDHLNDYSPSRPYVITGLVEERFTSSTSERYLLKAEEITVGNKILKCRNVSILLFAPGDLILKPGQIISFSSTLRKPEINGWTKSRDISYTAFLKDGNVCKILGSSSSLTIHSYLLKEKLIRLVEASSLSETSISQLKALLLAERGGVKKDTLVIFRNAGLSHILALSGMHTGILTMALLLLTSPLLLLRGRSWRNVRYLLVTLMVWAFAFLTGMNYSTVRAALMLSVAAAAWMMERQRDALSSVCFAAAIILLFSPSALTDVGFILSFACVASLCLFVERLNPVSHHNHPAIHKICSLLLTTIVATGATWIISAYYFGSVSAGFLLSNVLIVPLLPVIMILMIAYLIILAAGWEWGFLSGVIDFSVENLIRLASYLSSDSIEMSIPDISLWLWMSAVAFLGISLNLKTPAFKSGCAISQETTRVSMPWMIVALLLFSASVLSLIMIKA